MKSGKNARTCTVLHNQQGTILGLVLIFFAIFTMLGLTMISIGGFELLNTSKHANKIKAFYNAEAGIHKALWRLNKVSAAAATYSDASVKVNYNAGLKQITAVGSAKGALKTIIVTLDEADENKWPYALMAKADIHFGSYTTGTVNGDIHANKKIKNVKRFTLNGTASYGTNIQTPHVNWNLFKAAAIASRHYFSSQKTLDSRKSPYTGVWYFKKGVRITSNVVINGTLVSEKDVVLSGYNIQINAVPPTSPAALIKNDFEGRASNVVINGFVYCHDDFEISGSNCTYNGAIVTHDDLKLLTNRTKITYARQYIENLSGITFKNKGDDDDDDDDDEKKGKGKRKGKGKGKGKGKSADRKITLWQEPPA